MDADIPILTKYFHYALSREEQDELCAWRKQSPENEDLYTKMRDLRLAFEYKQRDTVEEVARGLAEIRTGIEKKHNKSKWKRIVSYAAVITALTVMGIFGLNHSLSARYTVISVAPNGAVKKVLLPDSSLVWLASNAELRIPSDFSDKERSVYLSGRGYFDIRKRNGTPFLVTSDILNVLVTGTSFDLTVNTEKKTVETLLVSGKVTLQNRKRKSLLDIVPGEKVVYEAQKNCLFVEKVDVQTFTAWHLDQITFENATLREIVNKLSLIYDVNINLESRKIAEHRFRYIINREESLTEVLDLLSYLAPIEYVIEGDEVFIYEKH
ncbi:MAG: DUF4974 domain-containing protein [Proteiniphilum sp.]|nr:DUF4974 domain-containing protein [Proteiniphilum sp.]MDD4800541.1 DUF4974 domain-containing protein [Proteiniphilum sp.]